MFVHLGNETVINSKDIIGIFDMESTTVSKNTRIFLKKNQKRADIKTVSYELPKSFILTGKKNSGNTRIFISPLATSTLLKRIENFDDINL